MINDSVGNYMFKVNKRNTRTRCEICQKLTVKIKVKVFGVFLVNSEHISQLVLVFLLLTWSRNIPAGKVCNFSASFLNDHALITFKERVFIEKA